MRVGTCHATHPGDVRSVHITLHISNLAVEVKVSINIMREFRIIEWPLISDRCSFAYTHQMIFTNKCNSCMIGSEKAHTYMATYSRSARWSVCVAKRWDRCCSRDGMGALLAWGASCLPVRPWDADPLSPKHLPRPAQVFFACVVVYSLEWGSGPS
jgi:hypothetical protein